MWPKEVPVAIVVAGVVLLPCLVGCAKDGGSCPEARGPFVVAGGLPTARLATLLVVKGGSSVRIPFALTNPTEEEIVYAVEDGTGLYHLDSWSGLYRDGQLVKEGRVIIEHPPFQKHQIRRLKPKETVVLHYKLPNNDLKPGPYELRLIYDIPPKSVMETEFGLTAMKLEQMILLEVRDE
jgi:hypothetical protein